MATVFQIVASDLSTVLFDLNDPTGANNADGVRTELAVGGALGLGAGSPDPVILSPASVDGGFVVSNRVGLGTAAWVQYIRAASGATTPDSLISAVGILARLLAAGGVIKYVANASAEVRYIDFEPSPAPALYQGAEMELYALTSLFAAQQGIAMQVVRQPFLRGAELVAATNLATNPTLTHDFDGTANRPDGWAWSGTTGLTAETMAQVEVGGVRRGVYRFTKADGTAASLQQTTIASTYASGDVGVFSFYARVVAVAGTPQMQATLQFKQADGTTNVGSLFSGGLVTLTTKWQRITVTTTAAGALTSRAQVSLQIDNADATSVVVEVCNAQPEKTALSPFRTPGAAVAYNPTSAVLPRKIAVWGEGNAPSLAKLRATADSLTMGRYRVYRVAAKAVEVLKATLHKSLRSGTLGADTASAADADAIDGNAAVVTYTEPDPSFGTDSATSGATSTTISVTPPASLAVGDAMVAIVGYWRLNAQIAAPYGWRLLGSQGADLGGSNARMAMHAWVKIADADDLLATSFDFEVLFQFQASGGGSLDYVAWVGRFPNIDPESPVDDFQFFTEAAATAITAASVTTSQNNHEIVTAYMATISASSGSLTFTAPAGTTPTYTEQDDRQSSTTWRAMAVYTGLLAVAGATGTKDATASALSESISVNIALRKATSVLVPRSTVTYLGSGTGALPAGEYDVWLRYRTTAACFDRLRVEYALKASPSRWIALPDFFLDARAATSFSEFEEHLMGRLAVPEDQPLDTLTIRVSSGRVVTSSAALKLDMVYLAPVFERAGFLSSDALLANGEHFLTVPAVGAAYHLASDSDQALTATVEGPTPVELEPGFQALVVWPALLPVVGYVDPPTEVTSAPTVSVTHAPRYRT